MTDAIFDIQRLITESGVPRRTIYFYVQQGLLPPPQGAGLAAYYTEEHLLRLRLVPVLRQAGLRLDDIRERFAQMSSEDMRRQLKEAAQRTAPAPSYAPLPVDILPPSTLVPQGVRDSRALYHGWGAQNFTHYLLPAGITLVVPEPLSPLDQQRLEQLLQAARRIFTAPNGQFASKE
jgi:DNA-binding transcriptional MerR regulator